MDTVQELEKKIRSQYTNIWRCAASWKWLILRNTDLLSFLWLDSDINYKKHLKEIKYGKKSIIPWVDLLKQGDLIFILDKYNYYGIAIAQTEYNYRGPFVKINNKDYPAIRVNYIHKLDNPFEHHLETHNNPATFTYIDNYRFGLNNVLQLLELDQPEALQSLKDYINNPYSSLEHKISRITWNTKGWIKPSGRDGKSKNKSFEHIHGYGHEEWLFDSSKSIDGYKYGFLEPIYKFYDSYIGKRFNISLYTIDGNKNQQYWVGTIHNVEVIDEELAEKVLKIYNKNGWLDEMIDDLASVSDMGRSYLNEWLQNNPLFNVRFKVEEINGLPDEIIPIDKENRAISSSRYVLLSLNDTTQIEQIVTESKKGFSFDETGSIKGNLKKEAIKRSIKKEVEVELSHNIIEEKFLRYLQKHYGEKKVKRECRAWGYNKIDIVRVTSNGYVFYEIKTYNQLLTSLRNALGQLLEYCLFPENKHAEKIVLVSNVKPDAEFIKYFNHLKNYIKIPLGYIHFCPIKEKIIEEL